MLFTDEEVFQGVDLPEEEGESGPLDSSTTDIPVKPCMEYAWWERVLHPSRPIVAAGETLQPMR